MMSNHYNLTGKKIFLTGANGQLGKGLAKALLEQGAFVYLADLHPIIDADLEEQLIHNGFEGFHYIMTDITKENSVHAVAGSLEHPVDVLINNAGVGVYTPFEQRTEEEIKMVVDVNIMGTILCSKIFSSGMVKRGAGKIINIGSIYGVTVPDKRIYGDSGRNSSEVYSATKAGVIHLTKYLAAYLAEYNVTVNSVSPGGIFNNQASFFVENYAHKTPLGRMAKVDDILGAVCFLSSSDADFITGQNIVIDGGFVLW